MRFTIVIIMLFIGHDAIMAMNAHDTSFDSAHELQEVAQECGTLEGVLALSSIVSAPQPPVAFNAMLDVMLGDSDSLNITNDAEPSADATTRRAYTQVFLN